jgi:hypothetical protein
MGLYTSVLWPLAFGFAALGKTVLLPHWQNRARLSKTVLVPEWQNIRFTTKSNYFWILQGLGVPS